MKLKISENIKSLRLSKWLTQSELALLLSVTPQSVSRWENGQAYPDIELLAKIADYFCITVDELMGRDGTVELAQKFRDLRQEYYKSGATNQNILKKLCDILEKLCALDPIKYAPEY